VVKTKTRAIGAWWSAILLGAMSIQSTGALAACAPALDFEFRKLGSQETVRLCDAYAGQVLLVVNTASRCGYTPQYEGLEALYRDYRAQGLVVLGFPSNDFGNQEPGDEQQIASFCRLTYDVGFPMFQKTRVAEGVDAHPFYRRLAGPEDDYPQWNFHKYVIDRKGRIVASFPSQVRPQDEMLTRTIEDLL